MSYAAIASVALTVAILFNEPRDPPVQCSLHASLMDHTVENGVRNTQDTIPAFVRLLW